MEGCDVSSVQHHLIQVALAISVANTTKINKKAQFISVLHEYENQLNVDDKKLLEQINTFKGHKNNLLMKENIIEFFHKHQLHRNKTILQILKDLNKKEIILWGLINHEYNFRQHFRSILDDIKKGIWEKHEANRAWDYSYQLSGEYAPEISDTEYRRCNIYNFLGSSYEANTCVVCDDRSGKKANQQSTGTGLHWVGITFGGLIS